MKKTFFLTLCLAVAFHLRAEVPVFDKPALTGDHLRLLQLMDQAHARADYDSMAIFSLAGIRLGSDDMIWYYNLACARSLQKRLDDAVEALNRAIDAGHSDVGFTEQDDDLALLRADPRYETCLKRMVERHGKERMKPLKPDAENRVTCTGDTLLWNSAETLFEATVQPGTVTNAPKGILAAELAAWTAAGTADAAFPILYVNRDGGASFPDLTQYPSVIRLDYPDELTENARHTGLPDIRFTATGKDPFFFPDIGNSSFRSIGRLANVSLPLQLGTDPILLLRQSRLLAANQLYFYSVGQDYEAPFDRFIANQPIAVGVAGGVKSELPFVETAISAVLAMNPKVRDALIRRGILGATLNMLLRASQKTVKNREDYLTRSAHPPAFPPANLDRERMVRMAHDLPEAIPAPPPMVKITDEPAVRPGIDFFDLPGTSENLCTTPFCATRLFRGRPFSRRYTITLANRESARIHWVLLQGDPKKVRITPTEEGAAIEVDYQGAYEVAAPAGDGQLKTTRIDIAVIAELNGYYSMPSLFCVSFLANETRVYDTDGKIRSIDYTRFQPAFVNPLISLPKNWRDDYLYAPNGDPLGWIRSRPLEQTRFTPEGKKVVAADAQGIPTKTRAVKYLLREVRQDDPEPSSQGADNGKSPEKPRFTRNGAIDLAEIEDDLN